MDSLGGDQPVPAVDWSKWEMWRDGDGVYHMMRLGYRPLTYLTASSPKERDDKIKAWEREHPET